MNFLWNLLIFALCFLLFGLGVLTGIIICNGISLESDLKNNGNCSNMSLFETASCLNDEVLTFYNYNLSNQYRVYDEEMLRTSGGVCWQYAEWYRQKAESYNLSTTPVKLTPISHKVMIISKEGEGYCLMDQQIMKCVKLGE